MLPEIPAPEAFEVEKQLVSVFLKALSLALLALFYSDSKLKGLVSKSNQ